MNAIKTASFRGQLSYGDDGQTLSPTIFNQKHYVVADDQVFAEEILWLSLTLGLVFLYVLQRKYIPWAVVLRDLPFADWRKTAAAKHPGIVAVLRSIHRTLFMDEKLLIKQCGLDGYLTLRLIRFCFYSLFSMALLSLIVLTPIYHFQTRTEKCLNYCASHNSTSPPDAYRSECVCGFIDLCSMANVPAGSKTLWATAASMTLITLWILFRLRIEYKEVVRIRHEFWSTKPSRLHSVFVDRIPRALAPQTKLKEFYEKLFPGQIYSVELLTPIEALKRVGERRIHVLMLLERAMVEKQQTGASPWHWAQCSGTRSCFERVDSADALRQELALLNAQFKTLKEKHSHQGETQDDENSRPRQAFVTFRDVTPAVTAAQSLVQENMVVKMAPDPNDVRWDSLGERSTAFTYFVRKMLSRILLTVVVIFWGGLTSLIGFLTSKQALSQQFESINDFLVEHPEVAAWVDRVSTLTYVILIAIVYPIIALSVKIEVRIAQSNVERAILERYFLFLVVQVFVFYSIAGSVSKAVVDIATNPSHIFTTLSTTIPQNASFFIGFIAIKTFWVMFDLVRGYNLIFALLRRIFFGRTVTERERHYQACGCCWDFLFPSPVNLSSANANILLVFFIATSYAVVQPLVTLAALIYFAAADLCFSLVLTTSSRQLFDGGGIFWTHTYWCVISSIVTAQMTLVGTLLTKQGYSPALYVFSLCIFTMVMASHINDKYRTPATEVTLEIASELDSLHSDSSRVVEEVCTERVFLYHVVGMSLSDGGVENDDGLARSADAEAQQGREGGSGQVVRVFRYVHPVLLEQDALDPIPKLHSAYDPTALAPSRRAVAPGDLEEPLMGGENYSRLESDE